MGEGRQQISPEARPGGGSLSQRKVAQTRGLAVVLVKIFLKVELSRFAE